MEKEQISTRDLPLLTQQIEVKYNSKTPIVDDKMRNLLFNDVFEQVLGEILEKHFVDNKNRVPEEMAKVMSHDENLTDKKNVYGYLDSLYNVLLENNRDSSLIKNNIFLDNPENGTIENASIKELNTCCENIEKEKNITKDLRELKHLYKTALMLKQQVGYFGGSLEFNLGLKNSMEYWVYLMSIYTKLPRNQHLDFDCPKSLIHYSTLNNSLMPPANQMTLSIGFAEYYGENINKLPLVPFKTLLNERFKKVQNLLLNNNNFENYVNTLISELFNEYGDDGFPNLRIDYITDSNKDFMSLMRCLSETEAKFFISNIMCLPWSSRRYSEEKDNELYNKLRDLNNEAKELNSEAKEKFIKSPYYKLEYNTANLLSKEGVITILEEGFFNIIDYKTRFSFPQSGSTVSESDQSKILIRPNVVGRLGNLLINVVSAEERFKKKLIDDPHSIDWICNNSILKNDAIGDRKNLIIRKSVEALNDWFNNANDNCKPIYSGPSGHTLGYLNLFYKQKISKNNSNIDEIEALFVMLAGLIGKKEHHTYDEVMTAANGIGKIKYNYKKNYKDLLELTKDKSDYNSLINSAIDKTIEILKERYTTFDKPTVEYLKDWKQKYFKDEN